VREWGKYIDLEAAIEEGQDAKDGPSENGRFLPISGARLSRRAELLEERIIRGGVRITAVAGPEKSPTQESTRESDHQAGGAMNSTGFSLGGELPPRRATRWPWRRTLTARSQGVVSRSPDQEPSSHTKRGRGRVGEAPAGAVEVVPLVHWGSRPGRTKI